MLECSCAPHPDFADFGGGPCRYATGVLSRNSSVHTNGSLALISVFAVCIAILATFGLGLWFGITFSSLIITLAFLLLGLGTDDTYVLVAAFQHPDVRLVLVLVLGCRCLTRKHRCADVCV